MNFDIELGGRKHRLLMKQDSASEPPSFYLDGKPCSADVRLLEPDVLSLLMDGKSYRLLLDPRPDGSAVVLDECRIPYRIFDPRSLQSRANVTANDSAARPIVASMPGRIVRLMVQVGDRVEARQGLIVVEAMKMQNELKAPRAGNVTRIAVEVGATVQAGHVLMVIE